MASTTRSAPVRRGEPSRTPDPQRSSLVVAPASVPRRLAAGLIDSILILVLVGIAWSRWAPASTPVQVRIDAETGERVVSASLFSPDWLAVLTVAVAAVYLIGFIALVGRTPGGWALGIRCIRSDTGGRPGWSVASRRWLVLLGIPTILGLVPVIGPWAWLLTIAVALSALFDRSGLVQGIHDRFAGDLVIRTR